MYDKYENAKNIIEKYNQKHLLSGFEKIDSIKKQKLIDQILSIDFEEINTLYSNIKENNIKNIEKIEPIPYMDKLKITEGERKKYIEKGMNAVKNGKLAIVTMAGGQGTRLRT